MLCYYSWRESVAMNINGDRSYWASCASSIVSFSWRAWPRRHQHWNKNTVTQVQCLCNEMCAARAQCLRWLLSDTFQGGITQYLGWNEAVFRGLPTEVQAGLARWWRIKHVRILMYIQKSFPASRTCPWSHSPLVKVGLTCSCRITSKSVTRFENGKNQ